MRRKGILFILFAMIIILLVAYPVLQDFRGVKADKLKSVTLEIPKGANASKIGEILKDAHILRYPWAFSLYFKQVGVQSKFQAGMHTFKPGMGYPALVKELLTPTVGKDDVRLVIPEGFEMKQIAQRVQALGLCTEKQFYDAANLSYNFWFLKDIPKRKMPLEGYLYPDTYEFSKGTKPEKIIEALLTQFAYHYPETYNDQAKAMGLTTDKIIILASMIEREVKMPEEMTIVSSIFQNRLKSKQYPFLQSCATVQYVLGERKPVLSVQDTKIASPYNTYLHKGLPIGPIASPGKKAIEAALNPDKTDYLFFVAKSDGTHIFSKTFAEHQKAVKQVEKAQ